MPHRFTSGLRSAPLLIVAIGALLLLMSVQADAAIPPVLARLTGFAGRMSYAGHRTDVANAPEVQGIASITGDAFVVDERAPGYALHADEHGVIVHTGSLAARSADALDADILINPWPIAVAALARGGLIERGPSRWEARDGFAVYVDRAGSAIDGLVPAHAPRLAFAFGQWSEVAGVPAPLRIVRLRWGVQDAAFQIDRLEIVRAADRTDASGSARQPDSKPLAQRMAPLENASAHVAPPFPWRPVLTLFGLLALAIAIVAWSLRDAFAANVSVRSGKDPRGWNAAASAAYVGPDGVLLHEGNRYHVGAEFFSRPVEVQHSALFLRISAPGISKIVVLPRRLPRFAPRTRRRATAAGLSLIETLVSMAFFTAVIVAGVYPALTAVTRADFVASQRRAALAAVANALTDEEIACAYGNTAPTGTATTTVNGMTVTVTVNDSSAAGARDIVATAADANGNVLATLATTVGPPVPAPGSTPAPPSAPGPPVPPGPPGATASATPTPPASGPPIGGLVAPTPTDGPSHEK
ncbi:MAG: hypothetical protein JO194_06935 [Candidatus Eremiobacteraeota bacterium]|nr:hypothetical protein [Candidatus Eremiobacteraeota bacterium]